MPYRYIGPADIAARAFPAGRPIRSRADFTAWYSGADHRDPLFTYVVTTDGVLRVAPRRSEHVACAAGADVLAAGEIGFDPSGRVVEVTNQSTGYCPDPSCWPAVAAALDAAGLPHPGGFTSTFVFGHCPVCGHLNLIKDDDYTCAVCGTALA